MTVRRRTPDGDVVQKVSEAPLTYWFRIFITIAILSMHPWGRSFLVGIGFDLPDPKAEEQANSDVTLLRYKVGDLEEDMKVVKRSVKETQTTVEQLSATFSGFQIDFDKYRK